MADPSSSGKKGKGKLIDVVASEGTSTTPGPLIPEELKKMFDDLNGLDLYLPALTADEPLTSSKLMVIPDRLLAALIVDMRNRDTLGVISKITPESMIEIAAHNYVMLKAAGHPDAMHVSCVRALIASRGIMLSDIQADQRGLLTAAFCKVPEMILSSFAKTNIGDKTDNDSAIHLAMRAFAENGADVYSKLANLLPVMASIQFIKTNHHYVNSPDSIEAYKRHFRSAVLEEFGNKYNRVGLIYDSVHWMGPFAMDQSKKNMARSPKGMVPRGLKIKLNATPAGTAVVKTQIAVWNSILAFPGGRELAKFYETEILAMSELSKEIDQDPLAFHVYAPLFAKYSKLEEASTSAGMMAATRLASVAQAFIDTIAKGTDLARARALKKHSDQNAALYKIASAAFKGSLKRVTKAASVQTLLQTVKMTSEGDKDHEEPKVLAIEPVPTVPAVASSTAPIVAPVISPNVNLP